MQQTMSANEIKNAVLAYYRFKRQFPYLATECLDSDVLVSDGQLLTEVEVKVAFGDYRREFKKGKYSEWYRDAMEENRGKPYACKLDPNFMFFAAPEELAHKIITDTEHHKYGHGVLSVKKRIHTFYTKETGQYSKEVVEVEVLKRAKKLHSNHVNYKSLRSIISRMASELITMRQQVRA